MSPRLHLELLPGRYAVVRLLPGDAVPAWFPAAGFRHATWTADELSLLCDENAVPAQIAAERGWCCLKLRGPFDFALTGILLAVLAPLAEAGIGIFAISTYDTDYVLVKETAIAATIAALRAHGHRVDP